MPRHKALLKAPSGGPKKIVIRPYSKPPTLPPNYYETTSQGLLEALENFSTKKSTTSSNSNSTNTLSLQQAYTQVVQLVRHQFGPRLHQDLQQALQQRVETLLPETNDTNQDWLHIIPTLYPQDYLEFLTLVRHVFLPLDRSHAWNPDTQTVVPLQQQQTTTASPSQSQQQQQSLQSLWQVGLTLFRTRLERLGIDTILYQQWKDALLQDWNGLGDDRRSQLQQVWYAWQDWNVLHALALPQDLQDYWSRQATTFDGSLAQFITYAYQKHQHVRVWQPWLPAPWLWSILEHDLLEAKLLADDFGLNPTLLFPLLEERLTDPHADPAVLQQLWTLMGRLPQGQPKLAQQMASFAKTKGLELVTAVDTTPTGTANSKTSVIGDLLDLQDRVEGLRQSLQPGGPEHINLKSVWEHVVNAPRDLAEWLAKYLDAALKSTKRDVDAEALHRVVRGLFVPLQSKDVFEAFYKKDLAKRLLNNRVTNMDTEKSLMSLFKAECGTAYTSKMEGMLQDMDWSRETMMQYKQQQQSAADLPATAVDMEVQVLTTGYWPVYTKYPHLILPESLKEPQARFEKYYDSKYQGRRLTWQRALGQCVVRCVGLSKPYDFVVSLCQALVLYQFNDTTMTEPWTIRSLMTRVGVDDRDEMERILQSLFHGKPDTRILRKLEYDGSSKKKVRATVDDRDHFVINDSFSNNMRRVRIGNVALKETKEERDQTVEAVHRDRMYLIDAALVRIMKSRKTLSHQALIPQVLGQLKFPAQPTDIKLRIEGLIERDYLERDPKDRQVYKYLA